MGTSNTDDARVSVKYMAVLYLHIKAVSKISRHASHSTEARLWCPTAARAQLLPPSNPGAEWLPELPSGREQAPSNFRPRGPNPAGSSHLSPKLSFWLTQSLVKGKRNVTYLQGLSRGLRWTQSKKGCGCGWGRGFADADLWATRRSRHLGERALRAHHFADNQEETACTYEYVTHIYAQRADVYMFNMYTHTHTAHDQTK